MVRGEAERGRQQRQRKQQADDVEEQPKEPTSTTVLAAFATRRSASLSLPSPSSVPPDGDGDAAARPRNEKEQQRHNARLMSIPCPTVNIIVPTPSSPSPITATTSTTTVEEECTTEEEEEADEKAEDNSNAGKKCHHRRHSHQQQANVADDNEDAVTLHASLALANSMPHASQQQHKQQLGTASSASPSPQHRRKASLMPPVTEEDLRNDSRMGHRDPESVAALFGADFASRFCLLPGAFGNGVGGGIVSPTVPPFSMQQLRQGLDPGQALLPHEIRDNSVPSGVPTVKMRRRVGTQPASFLLSLDYTCNKNNNNGDCTNSAAGTDEAVVPLSPVAPKFPSLPCVLSAFVPTTPPLAHPMNPRQHAPLSASPSTTPIHGTVHPPPVPFPFHFSQRNGKSAIAAAAQMVPFRWPESGQFYPDMAVSNPDLVQFQLVLNDWFWRHCKLRTSAFLLNSAELNMTQCQVCGTELANEEGPIQCGDAEYLDNLFDGCAAVAGCSAGVESSAASIGEDGQQKGTDDGADGDAPPPPAVVAKLDQLSEKLVQPLQPVLARLCRGNIVANECTDGIGIGSSTMPPISLVGIKANGGFTAILLAVHRTEHTREEELRLMRPHLDMMANLLSIFHNIEEQRRLAHQMQLFLCMTQNVFSSLQDMNQLVRNITKEAKALVHAEICSLFLLDKEHSELVAEVFEKNGTTDEYLTEIRMPLNQGIVGHVASTGQMMNVRDVYSHPNFYPKVDERTGFVTRNILCFPIKDSAGNLVGVAELCNKIGRDAFTRHDEQIAATFAVYCAISISHCLLYRKLQEAHRRSHITAELLVQSSTLSIAPEDILRLTVRDIPSPDSFHAEFNQFHFVPRSIGGGDIYVEASLSMFKSLGFIDRYRIRRRTLARFLLMVQKGYRDVPYHNWSHAFAVAHFCFLLLRMPLVKTALLELERFALLVACLCHDIDHRGTTNAFQLQSKTPLAQLYSSEGSVLERHHFAQTVSILGMDECNIFDQLNQKQYQQIMDCIREVILATDIAAHLRKVERIAEMAKVGFDSRSDEHRYLFTCLLMTASDLSDQSKDFRHSKAIAENIYKEFFSQGDLEKEMGNRPIEMMDRERACVPKIQIEFMDTVALPVFRLLAQLLPDLQSTHQALLHNRRCWMMLDRVLQEQGLPLTSGGLNYLRDENLEEKVIRRAMEAQQRAQEEGEEEEDGTTATAAGRTEDGTRDGMLMVPISVWRRLSNGGDTGTAAAAAQMHQRQWPSGAKKYSLGL